MQNELPLIINLFLINVSILYPLKTAKNQRFSGTFRGYKLGTLARNGLKWIYLSFDYNMMDIKFKF